MSVRFTPKRVTLLFLALLGLILLLPKGSEWNSYSPVQPTSNFILSMARWPCFGPCPAYEIRVFGDGSVLYNGLLNVNVEGLAVSQLSKEDLALIIETIEYSGFFQMKDSYTFPVTDQPGVILEISLDRKSKKVWHYGRGCDPETNNAPQALCELEQLIDSLTNSRQWVHGTPIPP